MTMDNAASCWLMPSERSCAKLQARVGVRYAPPTTCFGRRTQGGHCVQYNTRSLCCAR